MKNTMKKKLDCDNQKILSAYIYILRIIQYFSFKNLKIIIPCDKNHFI